MSTRTAVTIAVALALLGVADAVTTFIGVSSGIAEEANPAAAALFDKVGLASGVIATQALFIVIVAWMAWAAAGRQQTLRWTVPAACLLVLLLAKGFVVGSNVVVLTG